MTSPEMRGVEESRAAARFWAGSWDGQTFVAYGGVEPVLGPPVMEQRRARIRGCPPPMVIEGGGRFVQEMGRAHCAGRDGVFRRRGEEVVNPTPA